MSYDLTSNSVPVNPDTEVDLYGRASMDGPAPHPQEPRKPYRPLSAAEALAALDRYLGVDPDDHDDPDDPHDGDAPKTRETPLAPFPALPGRIVVGPALAAPDSPSTVTASTPAA